MTYIYYTRQTKPVSSTYPMGRTGATGQDKTAESYLYNEEVKK